MCRVSVGASMDVSVHVPAFCSGYVDKIFCARLTLQEFSVGVPNNNSLLVALILRWDRDQDLVAVC